MTHLLALLAYTFSRAFARKGPDAVVGAQGHSLGKIRSTSWPGSSPLRVVTGTGWPPCGQEPVAS